MPGAAQSSAISAIGPLIPCDSYAEKIRSTKFPTALTTVGETDQTVLYF